MQDGFSVKSMIFSCQKSIFCSYEVYWNDDYNNYQGQVVKKSFFCFWREEAISLVSWWPSQHAFHFTTWTFAPTLKRTKISFVWSISQRPDKPSMSATPRLSTRMTTSTRLWGETSWSQSWRTWSFCSTSTGYFNTSLWHAWHDFKTNSLEVNTQWL